MCVDVRLILLFSHSSFKIPTQSVGLEWDVEAIKSHANAENTLNSHPTRGWFQVPRSAGTTRGSISNYNPADIDVFYFNRKTEKYLKIDTDNPIYDVLGRIQIEDGMVNFTVLSRRSQKFYKEFLTGQYDE